MSLNKEQRRITAEELQAHFEASTLSVQMIAEKLNVTTCLLYTSPSPRD